MVQNFPGPYVVEIFYSVNQTPGGVLTHVARMNCNLVSAPAVGTTFDNISVVPRSAANKTLDTAVDELVAVLQPLHDQTRTSIINADLYSVAPQSNDRTYISSYAIGLPGSSGGAAQPAAQHCLSFKTQEGGTMRFYVLESQSTFVGRDDAPITSPDWNALAAYIVGTGGWLIGYDTSYPIVFRRWLGGQDERVFRQRYR